MIPQIKKAIAAIPSDTYTCNTRKYKDTFRVNIYENGTTRHILVHFWLDRHGHWACSVSGKSLPDIMAKALKLMKN